MKSNLATALVQSTHGIKGYLKVRPYSSDGGNLKNLSELTLVREGKTRKLQVQDIRDNSDGLLVKFVGIDTPEDARLLTGYDILVPRELASKLGEGEVYTADLIGMKLVYNNEEVAEVVSTLDGAQALLLEVKNAEGKRFLIPFMDEIFVKDIDILKGTMTLIQRELVE